jgi:3-methyladenine DNA glycosylase AlkD
MIVAQMEISAMTITYDEILNRLEAQRDPSAVAGMARYGIVGQEVFGVKMPILRRLAREAGRDHALAQRLWAYPSRETRILATLVDHWQWVEEPQMETWVADFDSWEVCDQACGNLFAYTPFAYAKALEWSARPEEFIKRAGFVLMADLAHQDKKTPDADLAAFLPIIEREAGDSRNFVKKAVNWALRDIGKRNLALNAQAIATAERLIPQPTTTARWNGRDARRELTSEKVQAVLQRRDH